MGFPGSSAGEESTSDAGDPSSIPGPGRSTGEGNGYTHKCSWLLPAGKESACHVGDLDSIPELGGSPGEGKWPTNFRTGQVRDSGSIPGLGRSPGGGNGNPFQYSCLENALDRGAWRPAVYRAEKRRTQLRRQPANQVSLGIQLTLSAV